MDTAMRDLEQIQEREPDEGGRKAAVFLLAGATTLGLVYAMVRILGAEPAAASAQTDPLAALGAAEALAQAAAEAEALFREGANPSALAGSTYGTEGQLAGQMARDAFAGPRWEALAARGARVQRPLWASTSTKNPAYPDTLYVDRLIGPDTVNTIPEATLDAFEDHGTLARTLDDDVEGARATWAAVGELVDLDDVSKVLEVEGVAAFEKSFDELLGVLTTRAGDLA